MELKCSISQERKYFLKKLLTNPIFLIKHLPSLSKVVWQRYRNKRNRKSRPPYVSARLEKKPIKEKEISETFWQRIPERSLIAMKMKMVHHHKLSSHAVDDREDYLAKYRFGELQQLMLNKDEHETKHYQLPSVIAQWIANPPNKQDLAWETYSSCERIANLLTWISFIPLQERAHVLPINIIPFLNDSLQDIHAHLEYYQHNTNNHILNNARALILCGVVLNHPSAISDGIAILKHMLPILIQPQGMLRERSTHYQLIVLNWLLDAYAFLKASQNTQQCQFLLETIIRCRNAAATFCDQHGFLQTAIGDLSPDITPDLSAERLRNCYPDFWPKKNELPLPFFYHQDDYFFINKNHHKIIFNCPTESFPLLHPSHGHNDITSFIWIYDDQPLLIDSGRTRYCKDPISTQQHSAYGHNLAFINDFPPCAESLVTSGHWWPTPFAKTKIIVSHQAANVAIKHDGFKRATQVKTHTRILQIDDDDCLQIEDVFIGHRKDQETVDIQLLWQLHPSLHPVEDYVLANEYSTVIVQSNAQQMKISENGWHSTQYGKVERHCILILKWRVTLPFTTTVHFKVKRLCAG